jgi:sugar lactone lactonase YvrE
MPGKRSNWFGFVVTATLAITACNSPLRARGVGDGSTTPDSTGGRDQAAEARSILPDAAVVTSDADLDRPVTRDSALDSVIIVADTPAMLPDASPDKAVADASGDQASDRVSLDGKDAGSDSGDRVDAALDRSEVAASDAPSEATLKISSTSLSFGSVALGFTRVRSFTVTNLGQGGSGFITITLNSSSDFVIQDGQRDDCVSGRTLLAGGASCTVRLAFTPSITGDRSGRLALSASPGGGGGVAFSGSGVTGTLSFLAGTASGLGSADGTGAAARFNSPLGLALDGSGNLFVVDYGNSTIRKITPAGVVSTFAGTPGIQGSVDGTGSAARFGGPNGVATDKAGNLYITDSGNNTIRKITPAGVVTTLAGAVEQWGSDDGTGSAARFNTPSGVAVDASGNVYVSDTGNNTIRKIAPVGVVTTLAGSAGRSGNEDGTGAAARFEMPGGLTLDASGNLLVIDAGAIRKVTPAGVVTTVIRSQWNTATALAVDEAGNIFLADSGDNTIRKITPAGVVTTMAGTSGSYGSADGTGAAARFRAPWGLVVDGSGNLLVTDSGSNAIRKITPAGVVTTFAGALGSYGAANGTGAAAAFNFPSAVAVDGSGNVLVADANNNVIRQITPAGVVTTLAGSFDSGGSQDGTGASAQFNNPNGLAIDRQGNVFVADSASSTIRKITSAGVVTTLAGPEIAGSTGTGAPDRFSWPSGLAVDGSGNLFVADTGNSLIRKITPAGVVTTFAGSVNMPGSDDGVGTTASFNSPNGLAMDSAGNLLVTDSGNDTIRKITPAGVVTTLAGQAGITGRNDGTGSAARFDYLSGLAVDSAGNAYVADFGNNAVRKVTPAGLVTTVVGVSSPNALGVFSGPLPGLLSSPLGVAISPLTDNLVLTVYDAVMLVSW